MVDVKWEKISEGVYVLKSKLRPLVKIKLKEECKKKPQ